MATKASTAGKKGASARKRSSASRSTQRRNARDTKTGTEPPRRSVEEHSAHPESAGDSTVRHADNPVGRKSAGAGGYPQGEYDPTQPAKRGAAKKDPVQLAIEQSLDADEIETIKAAQKHPKANRLKPEQRALALEALPIGAILEHEAKFRWRVKANMGGGIRWGHGATAQEAIDAYILGSSTQTLDDAGAESFAALPKSVQKEIEERDAKVAKRSGVSVESFPEVVARREFEENQKAARSAKAPARNAVTDGPEVASAQLEAGARRGGRGEANEARKQQASTNRQSANRRVRSGKAGSKK